MLTLLKKNQMNEVLERLKLFCNNSANSVRSFAVIANINPGTFNQQINGSRSLSLETINSVLSAFPSLSAEWLLRGNGSMLLTECATSSQNESDAIYYTRLAQIRQKRIEELEEQLARLQAV